MQPIKFPGLGLVFQSIGSLLQSLASLFIGAELLQRKIGVLKWKY